MLIPGRPIGLLIYNNSEFMQMPWESIVKKYRNYIGDKYFDTLQEYANNFLFFLSDPDNGLYSDEQYNVTFGNIAHYYLNKVAYKIDQSVRKQIEDTAKPINRKEITNLVSTWINHFYTKWDKYENQYSDEDTNILKTNLLKIQRRSPGSEGFHIRTNIIIRYR